MIATFNIFAEDLIAQQRNAVNNTKFHKKGRVMQIIVSISLVMFVLIMAGYSTYFVIFGFILCLILIPLIWKSYEHAILTRYKKDIIKQHKHKIGSFTLRLSEEELIKESHNLTEKFRWDELERLAEDEERYFLYFTDLAAITIKKEPDNMNEEQVMDYQSFIESKLRK
ncbi:YcxB family protein [Lentibacillus salinarum]|uniref:YcxB family protein n=1 Tax=Lentibacillus salinarum TaxID=446820 RepID=A0ABW3ZYB2_9BACI